MGGAVEAFSGFDASSIVSSATDLGSVVTDFGSEFLDTSSLTSFQVPLADVSSFGGFEQIGSLAGNASWFDTFNSGSILNSIPSVSDFSLSSITGSLPSLSSLNVNSLVSSSASALGISPNISSTVTKALSDPRVISAGSAALGINPVIASAAFNGLNTNSLVSAGASSLGINPTTALASFNGLTTNSLVSAGASSLGINPTTALTAFEGGLNTNSLVSAGASSLGINPNIATSLTAKANDLIGTSPVASIASSAQNVATVAAAEVASVDQYGLNILNDVGTAQVTKNLTLVNGLVDTGTGQQTPLNYNQATAAIDALTPVTKQLESQVNASTADISATQDNLNKLYTQLADGKNLTNDERAIIEGAIVTQSDLLAEQKKTLAESQVALDSSAKVLGDALNVVAATDIGTTKSPAAVPPTVSSTGVTTVVTNPGNQPGTDTRGLVEQARVQQTLRDLRQNKAQSSDWRVRLRLAPNSTYLYNDPRPGILAPLAAKTGTDGVIFPYTPAIETAYKANYSSYDLTHSNYRGYFYQNSYVDSINIRGVFTAQDTQEANYLLAVIHFFRSATKMFYGQDAERGSPPPLVFLSGLGDYQFSEHPSVISQFNYTLPPDVDYIRAGSAIDNGTNFLANRTRTTIGSNPVSFAINRLLNNALKKGAEPSPLTVGNLPVTTPTYVPTKIEISISLLPVQSRQQVSTQFSVKSFANGNLLRGGFW